MIDDNEPEPRASWSKRTFGEEINFASGCLPIFAILSVGLVVLLLALCSRSSAPPPVIPPPEAAPKPTYAASDFLWDDGVPEGKPYEKQIVASVNRLVRENDKCASVDPTSLAPMEGKFSKKHPIFWIACKTGDGQTFGTTFNAKEAASGRESLASVQPIDAGSAGLACKSAAEHAAQHPDTVDFSMILDANFQAFPDGRGRFVTTFSAENAFGVRDKYHISCFFDGFRLVERDISPWTGD